MLQAATKDLPEVAKGMKQLNAGFTKLTKNDSSLLEGANQLSVASLSLRNGASSLVSEASLREESEVQPVESSHSRAEQIPLNPEAVNLQTA